MTALTAAGGIFAARVLGPGGRGELAVAIVWVSILAALAGLGVPQALTYLTARDPASSGSILSTAVVLGALQSFFAVVGGWVIAGGVLASHQPSAVAGFRLYLLGLPALLVATYVAATAQGVRDFSLFNWLRIGQAMAYVGSVALAWALRQATAFRVVAILIGVHWLVALLAIGVARRRLRASGRFGAEHAAQILGYGLRSYLGNLSWLANARLDQFIMSVFLPVTSLGYYAVATSYATVLFPMSGAFAMMLFPTVAARGGNQGTQSIERASRLNLALSAAGALALGVTCPLLLPMAFGSDFSASVAPAIILLVGSIFLGSNYVLSDGIRGLGRPIVPSVAEFVGLVVTIAGLWVLLPRLGILGAAWTSLASYAIVALVLVAYLGVHRSKQRLFTSSVERSPR